MNRILDGYEEKKEQLHSIVFGILSAFWDLCIGLLCTSILLTITSILATIFSGVLVYKLYPELFWKIMMPTLAISSVIFKILISFIYLILIILLAYLFVLLFINLLRLAKRNKEKLEAKRERVKKEIIERIAKEIRRSKR